MECSDVAVAAAVAATLSKTRLSGNFFNHKHNIFVGENLSPIPNSVHKVFKLKMKAKALIFKCLRCFYYLQLILNVFHVRTGQ